MFSSERREAEHEVGAISRKAATVETNDEKGNSNSIRLHSTNHVYTPQTTLASEKEIIFIDSFPIHFTDWRKNAARRK